MTFMISPVPLIGDIGLSGVCNLRVRPPAGAPGPLDEARIGRVRRPQRPCWATGAGLLARSPRAGCGAARRGDIERAGDATAALADPDRADIARWCRYRGA